MSSTPQVPDSAVPACPDDRRAAFLYAPGAADDTGRVVAEPAPGPGLEPGLPTQGAEALAHPGDGLAAHRTPPPLPDGAS